MRRATLNLDWIIKALAISIHALLAESDDTPVSVFCKTRISIHALLAESDTAFLAARVSSLDFYPRSPCGERPVVSCTSCLLSVFLSTLSLRRATRRHRGNDRCPVNFYPRSPCGERLVDTSKDIIKTANFYPRSPCGERLEQSSSYSAYLEISIHALLAESDHFNLFLALCHTISIHALLAESDGT